MESKEIIIQESPPPILNNNQIGKPKKKLNKSKNLAQFLIIRNDGAVDMVYNKHDLKKGEVIHASDIIYTAPAYGIYAKFEEIVIGQAVNRDIPANTPITWDVLGWPA